MIAGANPDFDTPRLSEMEVTIDRDRRLMPVFVVGPDDDRTYPALIIVHEIFGLTSHIRNVARRFAAQKLRVFAPDLFEGAENLPADRTDLGAMRSVWQSIPDSQLVSDLKSVMDYARSSWPVRPDCIGTIGYCMGGAIALIFACETREIAFAIDYYGRIFYPQLSPGKPRHPIDYIDGLNCPLLGIFAGKDDLITSEHIGELGRRMEQSGKSLRLKVYEEAPHAFFNDEREHYRPEAAADAWDTTLDFIRLNCR